MHRWYQSELTLAALPRGCHLITSDVLAALPEIQTCRVGLLSVFIRHTSASLTINENADADVMRDLAMALDRIAPESFPYRHTSEGRDDMPAHVKATLTGSTLTIPVGNGRLLTGIWQGICLLEHRHEGGRRHLIVTLQGDFPE